MRHTLPHPPQNLNLGNLRGDPQSGYSLNDYKFIFLLVSFILKTNQFQSIVPHVLALFSRKVATLDVSLALSQSGSSVRA